MSRLSQTAINTFFPENEIRTTTGKFSFAPFILKPPEKAAQHGQEKRTANNRGVREDVPAAGEEVEKRKQRRKRRGLRLECLREMEKKKRISAGKRAGEFERVACEF